MTAATQATKSKDSANVFARIFSEMPINASHDAFVNGDMLSNAIASWSVEIDESGTSYHYEIDGLSYPERVLFHLLRHYCSCFCTSPKLDPDDPSRAIRLAAYAMCNLYSTPIHPGLKIDEFKKYSDRDGPAFVYAASFNPEIQRNKEARHAMSSGKFPAPKYSDAESLALNCPRPDGWNELPDDQPEKEDDIDIHSKELAESNQAIIAALNHTELKITQRIVSIKQWATWLGVIFVLVMIFRP